jgi:hypothetical protein
MGHFATNFIRAEVDAGLGPNLGDEIQPELIPPSLCCQNITF